MTRYNIEETAVYDKYVRWCGRTGPRGPSYPILVEADFYRSSKIPKAVRRPSAEAVYLAPAEA